MSWWDELTDWWNEEEPPPQPIDTEAERTQQTAAHWRQAMLRAQQDPVSLRPAKDPLLAAQAQWMAGDEPAAPNAGMEVGYSFDRPDVTSAPIQTTAPVVDTRQTDVMPFDPYAPKQRGWGVYRFGGDSTQPAQPAPELPAPSAFRSPYDPGNPVDPWVEISKYFGDTAAVERAGYDIDQRAQERSGIADTSWSQWAQGAAGNIGDAFANLGTIPQSVAQNNQLLRDELGQLWRGEEDFGQAAGDYWQGMTMEGAGAVPGVALSVAGNVAGATRPTQWVADQAMNAMSGLQAAQDLINTTPVAGNMPLGSAIGSAYEAVTSDDVARGILGVTLGDPDALPDIWKGFVNTYWKTQQRYVDALTPTAEQIANSTPEEIRRNQGRALLNWADPVAVATTFDALLDQGSTVTSLTTEAKRLYDAGALEQDEDARAELWTRAADTYAEAYELEHTHPVALVNKNTNIWRQMAFELVQPDLTDLAGGLFNLIGATPKARRLSGVVSEVARPAEQVATELADLAVGPQTRAAMLAERSTYDAAKLWDPSSWWTTGQARAHIATDRLHRFMGNLLTDVDTASDAQIILRQLAQEPARLITGMSADLFQSPGILARATEDGIVRFGSMGLDNIRESVRIFQQVAGEFMETAQSLKQGPLLNKIDFATELTDAMNQAGYRYFNVANELGSAPLGTLTTRLKSTQGSQYVVEYLGEGKQVLGASDPMLLADARKTQTNIAQQMGRRQEFERSTLGIIGSNMRKAVSPFYIYTSPGTWATNIIGGVTTALGDGTMAGGLIRHMDDHLAKLYGVDPTVRGLEGIENTMNVAGQLAGGILTPLKRAYSAIEENMGKRVYYSSVTYALKQTGRDVLRGALAPLLAANGIADPKQIRSIADHLFEVGYSGGNLVDEFNKMLNGKTRIFSLSNINPQWLDAISADSLEEFYNIVRKAPDSQTALAQLQQWTVNAHKHWDDIIQEAPTVPQRHVWMKEEVTQDVADLSQAGKMAQKYGGVPEAEIVAWKQAAAAAMTDAQRRMQTLMQVVAESADPKNRYMLYNTWGAINDMTANVRVKLSKLAEIAGSAPTAQRGQLWGEYWGEARRLWDERNLQVNELLENSAGAIARGEDFTPHVRQWDILERAAKQNEQKLWDTLRLEPGSGEYDKRLALVIEAGRAISDKAVARAYAAARRFADVDAIDYIVSAERNAQLAGAQARSYLDTVLEEVLQSGKWDDYFQIRNETWRQLRQYEKQVWGMATRNIVRDGINATKSTGLTFDAGIDGIVELIGPEQSTVQKTNRLGPRLEVTDQTVTDWMVRREDGTVTRVPNNLVPADVRNRYNGVTPDDIEAEVSTELDNIASAQPFADDADAMLNAPMPTIHGADDVVEEQATAGVLRRNGQDVEVMILGEGAGDNYRYRLTDGTVSEAPMDNLLITDAKGRRRNLRNIREMNLREGEIALNEEVIGGVAEARNAIRTEWDAVAKAEGGFLGLDAAVRSYVRGGIANVPENKFEDLYGTVIAGHRIENQEDVNKLLQEYYDLNREAVAARAAKDVARNDLAIIRKQYEQVEKRVKKELNLGSGANQADLEKVSDLTVQNTTAAGGAQSPEIALAAMHAKEQLQNLYEYMRTHLDEILTPAGAISQGQNLRALDDFRRTVLPAWDNAKFIASEFGNKMRSFTMVDFANNTRLDEIMGLIMPYGFWFTRSAKNSLERAIFEPHVWRRVMQSEREIAAMQEQRGDPERYKGSIPIDLGNGTTYYLRLSPSKYWPTFGMFTQNDYADPESANNAFSFAVESISATNGAPFPWIKAGSQIFGNYMEGDPLLQDVYPMSYIPQGRLIGWAAAKAIGPQLPWALRPGYYEYNVARELTTMVTEGEISAQEAQWAQDILRQMKTGEKPLPEQAAMGDALLKILNDATQRAANKEMAAAGSSLLTGVGVRTFDQDERQAMEATQRYHDREYSPESNPYGGETAQSATFEQYPELGPKFSQGSIRDTEDTRPGASAAKSALFAERAAARDALYGAGSDAVDALIASDPSVTKKEIDAARANAIFAAAATYIDQSAIDALFAADPTPYYGDAVDLVVAAIEAKYPSADLVNPGTAEKAYNPVEQQDNMIDAAYTSATKVGGAPVWPGDDATPAAKRAYVLAKEAYDQQQRQRFISATAGNPTSLSDTLRSVPGVGADEAGRLFDERKSRNKTDAEKKRLAEIEIENKAKGAKYIASQAEFKARRSSVEGYFGAGGADMWDQYYALPKGEARQAFIKTNPVMRAINLYAYNQAEMETAIGLFGDDALGEWALAPAYADTEAARAARSQYWDANPNAFLFHSWLNGRPSSEEEGAAAEEGFRYNFGGDYATAQEMFGDDIWAAVAGYKRSWNSAIKRDYYEQFPQLSKFFDWWYGNLPKKEGAATGATGGGRSGGGGGGGGGYGPAPKRNLVVNMPDVYGQGLTRSLGETVQIPGYAPARIDTSWLNAGRELRPGEPSKWSPSWIRGIKANG